MIIIFTIYFIFLYCCVIYAYSWRLDCYLRDEFTLSEYNKIQLCSGETCLLPEYDVESRGLKNALYRKNHDNKKITRINIEPMYEDYKTWTYSSSSGGKWQKRSTDVPKKWQVAHNDSSLTFTDSNKTYVYTVNLANVRIIKNHHNQQLSCDMNNKLCAIDKAFSSIMPLSMEQYAHIMHIDASTGLNLAHSFQRYGYICVRGPGGANKIQIRKLPEVS